MPAPIAALPTLFNTGQATDYSLLAGCAADAHWGGVAVTPNALWTQDGGPSRWVSPSCDTNQPPGNYSFQTTFTIPAGSGINALSGRIGVDNSVASVTVNNAPVPVAAGTVGVWAAFTIPVVEGQNTVAIVVKNAVGAATNPTGLRVEWQTAGIARAPKNLTVTPINS